MPSHPSEENLLIQIEAGVAGLLEHFEGRVAPRLRRQTRNKLATGLKNPKNKNSQST